VTLASPTPAPDRDGDGVLDASDQCPDVAGDARPDARKPGCPSDQDDDGVWDLDDRCPTVPGARSVDASRNGCPPDSDGDSIVDTLDACPNEAGVPDSDPAKNGCPTAVRVTGSQIVVTQNVNFATGSATLDPASEPVLVQVAQVLREHPEVVRVAVDGHTDNQGLDQANLVLSRKRAVTVVRWLVEHGIDERRLEARGYGARRPIADNKTPEGQAKNRRVEFLILKRDARGDAAWKDGAVHE
jgi:OOP family OmpA-OmpF porin